MSPRDTAVFVELAMQIRYVIDLPVAVPSDDCWPGYGCHLRSGEVIAPKTNSLARSRSADGGRDNAKIATS